MHDWEETLLTFWNKLKADFLYGANGPYHTTLAWIVYWKKDKFLIYTSSLLQVLVFLVVLQLRSAARYCGIIEHALGMHVCKEFSNRKRKELEQELERCCVQRHFGLCSTCFVYVTAVYRSCTVLLLQHGMRLAM